MTDLFWQHWRPEHPRAVLINVHGLGDHSGMYPSISAWFPPRGVAVYALDTRGNGRSPGRRGHIDRWSTYREDLRSFIATVHEREGMKPVLLGQSLGGLMVIDCALSHPELVRGVAAADVRL